LAYHENAVKWLVFHCDTRSKTIRGGDSFDRKDIFTSTMKVDILAGVPQEKQALPVGQRPCQSRESAILAMLNEFRF
jgi:hypothetical protein